MDGTTACKSGILRSMVELVGSILFSNNPQGSVFTIRIPLVDSIDSE